mgnify:FL=1|tara:strand:+ start:32 stop:517 length:486 start_codon:yes stop_codon:yes gene_type:complete
MHSNDSNKLKNFIQGLRPFSSSIPKTLKKHLKKGGYNYSNVVDNWTKIVTKKISDSCYPITIKMGKEMKNGTLILNVLHGKELEIEYSKKEIIDNINSFFGYDCITHISLKIAQEKISPKRNELIKIKNLKEINKKIDNVNNNQLKSSLNNLLKAFSEKNE